MKKALSVIVIFMILFAYGFAGAEEPAYQTRNVFFDDDFVMYVASANGMLYTLRDSGLYGIAPDETQTRIAPASALDERMYTILSDGQTLYGLVSDGTLALYTLIDENGNFVNQRLFETDAFADIYLQNPVARNGMLYFLFANGNQTNIVTYAIATDEAETIPLSGILCFDVMENGQILALQQETHWPDLITSLITVTPETGETALWAEVDTTEIIRRIAYDSATQTAYLFKRSAIAASRAGRVLEHIDTFIAGDVIAAALLPSGAALIVDDSLIIRNFDTAIVGTARRLTILQQYGRGEEYRDFLVANPHVDLAFIGPGNQTSEEKFVQDMATHNTDIDIYILSDTNLLHSIKQKGYFVDMAQSSQIQTLVNQMYAPIRDALMIETQIVAFPKETFFQVLCYHQETMETLGITLPKTYEAYFEFCLAWLDSYADSCSDVALNPFANNISLETLLASYADEQARNNETIQYSTETMERVIETYQAVQKAMDDQDSQSLSSTPLFYSYAIPLLGAESAYMYLPLTFEEGAEVAISPQEGDFSYFMINPYAANAQDALALIASFDSNRTGSQTALLYESIDSAIENESYQSESARLQETLDMLEASYASAQEDMRKDWEDQITAQKNLMAEHEKASRWAVSQSAIALYKEHADWLYINNFNPFTSLLNSLGSEEQGFLQDDGNMDIAALLAELDRRIHMLLLEEGMQ